MKNTSFLHSGFFKAANTLKKHCAKAKKAKVKPGRNEALRLFSAGPFHRGFSFFQPWVRSWITNPRSRAYRTV